jgi:hypothetical protein
LAGLTSITRWQDAVYALVPFTYDLLSRKIGVGSWLRTRAMYAGVVGLFLVPQLWQWHTLYGHWLLVPQGAGFVSLPPRFILDVLFSDFHGWFLWTPLTLIGILGLISRLRERYTLIVPLLLTVALEVAVVGSMPTNWHCNDSFGIRALTSVVPIVGLGVMLILNDARPPRRALLAALCIICVAYTTLFAVQFRLDLVPRQSPVGFDGLVSGKYRLISAFLRAKGQPNVMMQQFKDEIASPAVRAQ